MNRRVALALILSLLALLGAGAYLYVGDGGDAGRFVEAPTPLQETERLFDIGVVDADGDDRLDLYTSNHHFRQALLLADGRGGYRDVLSAWGLDQSSAFPLAELSFITPKPDRPGVYVYWRGTNLVLRTHGSGELGEWRGLLHTEDPVAVVGGAEGVIGKKEEKTGIVTETRLEFALKTDAQIVLQPGGQGLPIHFEFSGDLPPERIFVGRGKVSPPATRFTLAMQDRHAHAWADFNNDGLADIYINRGALSGTLRAHGAEVARGIRDELFLSQGPGRFREAGQETGIRKDGCSGRHAKWVDFDGDGLLDLFVNCYDRQHVAGDFPKQLYRQNAARKLENVAAAVGLALPDQQMGNMAWLDADADGDADLLAFQDAGVFLYRNQSGRYLQETVVRMESHGAPKIGETNKDYWIYDGKLAVMDYDADGDLDVFLASRRGNRLLVNRDGRLEALDPAGVGLPAQSGAANWADHDNDGLPDLHLFPQGLFRQKPDHTFEATGLLATHPEEFEAAIVNWFDMDNDGRLDALLALERNPGFKRWWEFGDKKGKKGQWLLSARRNVGPAGHWLQVRLAGGPGNRSAVGAQVTVVTPLGALTQEVGSSEGAFYSQGHYRLHYGLGPHDRVQEIRVRWSDGTRQHLRDVAADRLLVIQRTTDPVPMNPASTEARR